MSRPNPGILLSFLVLVLAAMGGLALAKGGLFINRHEGDTLHVLQIVLRMADGEWPHLDFMTPIGVLAFAPIAGFVERGVGVGHAFLYAQILAGALLLPAAWWVGWTRLSRGAAYLFGLMVLVLATALVHGEAQGMASISMHYNRWAWAAAFVAIALALLPPRDGSSAVVDGAFIGLAMAAIALIKMTYFAAFALPVLLALVLRKQTRALVVAALAGLAVAGVVTLWAGVGIWAAYLGDLLTVARSEVRPAPGADLRTILSAPAYLGGTVVVLAGAVLLRQAGQQAAGLVLLLLAPGFFYVTYQNFGNDPQWLMLLAILLYALRPGREMVNGMGWNLRRALGTAATAALMLTLPSFLNMLYSPLGHYKQNAAAYSPLVPGDAQLADLLGATQRLMQVNGQVALDGPGSGLGALQGEAGRKDMGTVGGQPLPDCKLVLGLPGWIGAITADLEASGLVTGKRLLAADLFSSHWLFSPELERLDHGAPWYYGGLPGFDSADFLLVPLCPVAPDVRRQIVEAAEALPGVRLTEVRRSPLYILYEKRVVGGGS